RKRPCNPAPKCWRKLGPPRPTQPESRQKIKRSTLKVMRFCLDLVSSPHPHLHPRAARLRALRQVLVQRLPRGARRPLPKQPRCPVASLSSKKSRVCPSSARKRKCASPTASVKSPSPPPAGACLGDSGKPASSNFPPTPEKRGLCNSAA